MQFSAESFLAAAEAKSGRSSRAGAGGPGTRGGSDNFSDTGSIASCSYRSGSRASGRGPSGAGVLSYKEQLVKYVEEEKEQARLIQDLLSKSTDPSSGIQGFEAVPWARFVVINFLSYGLDMRKNEMPCEWAITEWNIANGVGNSTWGLIDIGRIPPATGHDVKRSVNKTKCPIPPFMLDPATGKPLDYDFDQEILLQIEEVLKSVGFDLDSGEPGLVFTLRSNMNKVYGCLDYACERAGRPLNIRILPFELLAQTLFSIGAQQYEAKVKAKGDMPHSVPLRGPDGKIIGPKTETDVLQMVSQPHYQAVLDLTCSYHRKYDNCDGMDYCPMSENKRMIFSVLESLPDYFEIFRYLGKHYPRQDVTPIEDEFMTPDSESDKDKALQSGPMSPQSGTGTPSPSDSSNQPNPTDDSSSYSTISNSGSVGGSLVDLPTSVSSQSTTTSKSAATLGGPRKGPWSAREFDFTRKEKDGVSCSSSTTTISVSEQSTAPTPEPSTTSDAAGSEMDKEETQAPAKNKSNLPGVLKPTEIPMETKQNKVGATPLDAMLSFLQLNPQFTHDNFEEFVDEFDYLQKNIHKYTTQTYPQQVAKKVVSQGGLRHDSLLAPGVMFWDLGVGKKNEVTGSYVRAEAPGDGPIPLFNSFAKAKIYDKYCNLLKLRRKMLKKLVQEEEQTTELLEFQSLAINPFKKQPKRQDDGDDDDGDNDTIASESTIYFRS